MSEDHLLNNLDFMVIHSGAMVSTLAHDGFLQSVPSFYSGPRFGSGQRAQVDVKHRGAVLLVLVRVGS